MRIKIIQIGKEKDRGLVDMAAEFEKRIKPYAKLEIVTLKDIKKTKTMTREICVREEGVRVLKEIKLSDYVMILDEKGKHYTSQEFSKFIETKKDSGQTLVFVIGGPLGIGKELLERGNQTFSMSKMTFTHLMIRPFLLEQIYRGICIMLGKEYHID